MTGVEAKEVKKLQSVIGAWYQAGLDDKTGNDAAAEYRNYFPTVAGGDPSRAIGAWLRRNDKRTWHPIEGYFSAAPVTTPGRDEDPDLTLWPLVNFHFRVRSGRLQSMIRVVLCAENAEGLVDAWGWRFDSADEGHGEHSHQMLTYSTSRLGSQDPRGFDYLGSTGPQRMR